MSPLQKDLLVFAIWLSACMLFCLLVYQAIYIVWPDTQRASYIILIFLGAYFIMLLTFFIQIKALYKNPDLFLQIIILALVIKLVLFGILNFIMIYNDVENAMPNVLAFFGIYFLCTATEIGILYPKLNNSKG